MIAGRSTTRLPGIRFEAQAPALPEILPRMDIAVFVGFAASGPLHIPVAVESAAQFAAIFGEDAPLAWDKRAGVTLRAYLAPAVRAFFRNGGKRCWIVRVARDRANTSLPLNRARPNFFPIPGLVRTVFAADGKTVESMTPAFAQARSEGSWSDGLKVSATIETRPLHISRPIVFSGNDYVIELESVATDDLKPGDLLRLTFKTDDQVLLLAADKVEPIEISPPSNRRYVRVIGRRALRFEPIQMPSPVEAFRDVTAIIYTREMPGSPPSSGDVSQPGLLIGNFACQCPAQFRMLKSQPGKTPAAHLELQSVSLADAPEPGSMVCFELDGKKIWMSVAEQGISGNSNVSLRGQALSLLDQSAPLPVIKPYGERLSFELWVRLQGQFNSSLRGLTFDERHGQFWASALPTDEQLFHEVDTNQVQGNNPAIMLRPRVGNLFRFPLAGMAGAREAFFPLAVQTLPDNYLGAVTLDGTELERDGLAEFDAALFLDEGLAATPNEGLLPQADFIRYLSPKPRALRGIHAALGIEEATIIAVPDSVHPGWGRKELELPGQPKPFAPPLRPEWWHFLPCQVSPTDELRKLADCDAQPQAANAELPGARPVHEPLWENFLDCSIRIINAPMLSVDKLQTRTGIFTLLWQASPPEANLVYEVQESATANFSEAVTIYAGQAIKLPIIGRQFGTYYYRVKAISGRNFSDWSNGVAVLVSPASQWELTDEKSFNTGHLVNLQRAVLRMCSARGDLFAVFSLPRHFREKETIEHLSILRSKRAGGPLNLSTLFDFLDDRTLSFGAVWHPWLSGREENRFDEIRSVPPCGAMAGVLAKRDLARGAWIAPANEPLKEIVALTPPMLREDWLDLQEARLNLIRQEARGFLSLNSDTLSGDTDLRQINVRRLLSLLRRLALKHGATYVFEPNSRIFHRAVKRGFEAFLNQMFARGAFAGTTAATSFQVVVDESVNSPRSLDQGRFIVELRVAPSLPMRFLTVRLVQTGDRGLVQEA